MKDEEEAKEYAKLNARQYKHNDGISFCTSEEEVEKAYLAGLKAGKDIAEADLATIAYMQGAERYRPKWHYVKDGDLPEEGETVICFCRGYCGASFCATARLYIGYDDKVRRWWTNAGAGKSEQLIDVIAWKEIVFPKEIE